MKMLILIEFSYCVCRSKFCIPMEMVCDGYPDCPNGEDESNCIKLRKLNNKWQYI